MPFQSPPPPPPPPEAEAEVEVEVEAGEVNEMQVEGTAKVNTMTKATVAKGKISWCPLFIVTALAVIAAAVLGVFYCPRIITSHHGPSSVIIGHHVSSHRQLMGHNRSSHELSWAIMGHQSISQQDNMGHTVRKGCTLSAAMPSPAASQAACPCLGRCLGHC